MKQGLDLVRAALGKPKSGGAKGFLNPKLKKVSQYNKTVRLNVQKTKDR
jgi:hypothetical protein